MVNNLGWLKIHRSLLDWEWYTDTNCKVLFIHLLLTSNIKDKKWRGLSIKKGSRITGRIQLSSETGLSQQQVRTALKKLLLTNEVTTEKTSLGTIYTVSNWQKYQITTTEQPQDNQRATREQPESNQRATTTKEDNNTKKEEKEKKNRENIFDEELKDIYPHYEEVLSAYEYLKKHAVLRIETFEMQNMKTFDNYDVFKTNFNSKVLEEEIAFNVSALFARLERLNANWNKSKIHKKDSQGRLVANFSNPIM